VRAVKRRAPALRSFAHELGHASVEGVLAHLSRDVLALLFHREHRRPARRSNRPAALAQGGPLENVALGLG
jgi:hypothetical protein